MNGWYYKSFDLEFGPVAMDQLVELIKGGTLHREDEVRFGDDGPWRRVGSIGPLMAHLPFAPAVTPDKKPQPIAQPSTLTRRCGNDDWYYKSLGLEVGPVSLDRLIELIKALSLSRYDEVRFGDEGLWRRIGSIGPLMTHLPFEAPQSKSLGGKSGAVGAEDGLDHHQPTGLLDSLDLGALEDFEQDDLTINHPVISSSVSEARTGTMAETSPRGGDAKPRETDVRWWCTVQEKEYGPIDLAKLIEWAASGRLRRDDHVRYALEPYILAGDLPGLFPQLPNPRNVDKRTTAVELDQPVVSGTATSRSDTTKPNSSTRAGDSASKEASDNTKSETATDVKTPTRAFATTTGNQASIPVAVAKTAPLSNTPAPRPASASSPRSLAAPPPASFTKPVAYPIPKNARSGSSGFDLTGLTKTLVPVVVGMVGIAGVGALIYFGSGILPVSSAKQADQFKLLTVAYAEFTKARGSGSEVNDEVKNAQKKVIDVTTPIIVELDKIEHRTNNQTNVSRLAKKMMQVAKAELTKSKSQNETEVEKLMKVASTGLGIKN